MTVNGTPIEDQPEPRELTLNEALALAVNELVSAVRGVPLEPRLMAHEAFMQALLALANSQALAPLLVEKGLITEQEVSLGIIAAYRSVAARLEAKKAAASGLIVPKGTVQ